MKETLFFNEIVFYLKKIKYFHFEEVWRSTKRRLFCLLQT